MKYIVLLRGINISGKNKIAMNELKKGLNNLGYKNVMTYLNSGNVILNCDTGDKQSITNNIHIMIKNKFNLEIPIYITTPLELEDILNNRPKWWGIGNKEIYDNIIFIIPPTKYQEIYDSIGEPKKDLENIQEYKDNIFWSFNLKEYRKTNWWSKTATTTIANKITIRTANTMRKILELCKKDS